MRVADIVADFLVFHGVDTVFLLSGGGMMHLMDGLTQNKNLRVVCHHHEQAAGMAAEGYARVSGKLAACFGTSGPGATNLVTSIAGAWLDSTPVLYFTGQSKLSQTIQGSGLKDLRQFGTFEVDISSVVRPITKRSYFLSDPSSVVQVLEEAYEVATSGRPGPVLIDIPVDIQGAKVAFSRGWSKTSVETRQPVSAQVSDVFAKWKAAKRPLVWVGHGVRTAGQTEQLKALVTRMQTPVVTTMLAKDAIEYNNPLFIGHPGVKGDRAGNWAVQSADFILFLGSSLHVLNTGYELDKFAAGAFKVQIDLDTANFDREAVGVNIQLKASVQDALHQFLVEQPAPKPTLELWSNWTARLQEVKTEYSVANEDHKGEPGRINLFHVMEDVNSTVPSKSIVVTDAGSAFYVVGQALRAQGGQRVLSSGGLGSMGWAVPAASGASFARPDTVVVCITGDGSLQTNLHELGVISFHRRNVKLIVLNNEGYLSIKNTQDNYFQGRHLGVDEQSGVFLPDLKKISSTFSIPYVRVTKRKGLIQALRSAFSTSGPLLIDIRCNLDQQIIPTVSSMKHEDGRMESRPLEDMYPFLARERLEAILGRLRT